MPDESIEIKISKRDGKIRMEAFNFVGGTCTETLNKITEAIGGITVSSEDKVEKAQIVTVNTQQIKRG